MRYPYTVSTKAICDQGVKFTYRQFGERVAALSSGLSKLGLKNGETAAILCPNTHHYMEAYYACAVSGFVLNPLNFRLAAKEISTILEDSNAKAIIIHQDFYDLFKKCDVAWGNRRVFSMQSISAKTSRIRN